MGKSRKAIMKEDSENLEAYIHTINDRNTSGVLSPTNTAILGFSEAQKHKILKLDEEAWCLKI